MNHKKPILLILFFLMSLALVTTTSAQTPPGTPGGHPNDPGGFGTPPSQGFEEFTIRLEPALGSPRCPVTEQDKSYCEPVGWLSTRSQNYVNIRGEAIMRGSGEVPQGVQMTSSFVASQDDTNVALQFSAEAYVEDDQVGLNRRMFVRALVDGDVVDPSNVVFARGMHQGTQSFIFTTNVDAGIHTVEIQWKVDADATAFVRDASLLVRMGRDEASSKGTFTTTTAPSGANISTISGAWVDVPGMSLNINSPKNGQVTASFSAEAWTTKGKRMILRAVIDGNPMNPGDVVFVNRDTASSQAMTFGIQGVTGGAHTVKIQWKVEAGGSALMGDRSLAVAAMPVKDGGPHQFIAAASGANVYTPKEVSTPVDMDGMSIKFEVGPQGNGEVAVQFSAEIDATGNGVAMVGLEVDGNLIDNNLVKATDGSQPAQVKSFVFEAKHLTAGSHTATIVFASDHYDGQAYVGDRTMNLISETGFIPDLAEAPRFSGGHIGVDSDRIAGIEPLIGTRKVLAILIDPGFCEGTFDGQDLCHNQFTVPAGKVEQAIFGSSPIAPYNVPIMNNIATMYASMSGDRFTIERGGPGIAGWFSADKAAEAYVDFNNYYGLKDGECKGDFDDGYQMLYAEAVEKADAAVNFSSFDVNGDGKVDQQELGIMIVIPRADGDGSSQVALYAKTCGNNERMVLDGVELPDNIAKWNTSLNDAEEVFQFTTGAHELMHILAGLDDMYFNEGDQVSTYMSRFSLMSQNRSTTTHLDPLTKLALGWATPVLVDESTTLNIRAVEKSNVVYILPRYNHESAEEFYILENRQMDQGVPYFDENILESGIAVWHIVADSTDNQLAPVGTTQAIWDASHDSSGYPTSQGQMSRNGIRLIRPFKDFVDGLPVFDMNGAGTVTYDHLWTKADYTLESKSCLLIGAAGEQLHNRLSWADCDASGYNLRFLDPAQETMAVQVIVQ